MMPSARAPVARVIGVMPLDPHVPRAVPAVVSWDPHVSGARRDRSGLDDRRGGCDLNVDLCCGRKRRCDQRARKDGSRQNAFYHGGIFPRDSVDQPSARRNLFHSPAWIARRAARVSSTSKWTLWSESRRGPSISLERNRWARYARVKVAQTEQPQSGSTGRVSVTNAALKILSSPSRVIARPLRPQRVG